MLNKRIDWIDISKGIFMFFVILSHAGYRNEFYYHIYTPFFLSGFFLVSGLFFYDEKRKYSDKFIKIIYSILVPYLIYWFLSFSILKIINREFDFIPVFLKSLLKGEKLWFASCLFISEVITLNVVYVLRNKYIIYIYPIVSLILYFYIPMDCNYWYFRTSFLASFYLGIGIIIKMYINKFISLLDNSKVGYGCIFIYFLFVVIDNLYIKQTGYFLSTFKNYTFFILESFIGIYMILFIAKRIQSINISNLFKYIGLNSLLYYFLQNQALNIVRSISLKIGITNNDLIYPIFAASFVIILLIIPINFLNKYFIIISGKYLPSSFRNINKNKNTIKS